LGYRVWVLGCGVWEFGFGVQGLGFRVWDPEFGVQGVGSHASIQARRHTGKGYRGTSLIRKRTPLGPYSRPMHRGLRSTYGVGVFL